MTVKEIVIKYLKDNGLDGLCNEKVECGGCKITTEGELRDFAGNDCFDNFCPVDFNNCVAAKKGIAKSSGEFYRKGAEIYVPVE